MGEQRIPPRSHLVKVRKRLRRVQMRPLHRQLALGRKHQERGIPIGERKQFVEQLDYLLNNIDRMLDELLGEDETKNNNNTSR